MNGHHSDSKTNLTGDGTKFGKALHKCIEFLLSIGLGCWTIETVREKNHIHRMSK